MSRLWLTYIVSLIRMTRYDPNHTRDEFFLHDLHTQHEINRVELELTYKALYI
jgi:hypothetical protein